ncbi:FUSC family protein [Kitasatospora sp. NBC_01250]|uniref:FUSC family protein n=1 Tax=Kitasatospora sp. NBC_01250 TaxID=2903571 RepID=UPI002E3002A6|nr:FUSC family protein [Kitasatospora sp. NBC_01250]
MTAGRLLGGGAPGRWLRAQPEGPAALRRAARVTVAGCAGFYPCRYGLGDSVIALYAIFGALPLSLFCRIPGGAAQRARTLLLALPAGWVLVTMGTLLAVHAWAAAIGMFVVGFIIAFLTVGGPRPAGLAIAFQLFYVLPCFPPYAPGSLGSRLIGLTIGIVLAGLAERLVFPGPPPVPYRVVLADAVAAVAAYSGALADDLRSPATPATAALERQVQAERAYEAARPVRQPSTERPTSPSARDRALNQACAALWHIRGRLDRLLDGRDGKSAAPAAAALLDRVAASLRADAEALCTGTAPLRVDGLDAALGVFDASRVGERPPPPATRLLRHAMVREVATATWVATEATRIALGVRPPAGERSRPYRQVFWYAFAPAPVLWWRRLGVHLTPRSVHLQNALRTAVALAAARLLVGALDLSHGFWVLLATVSLMRTSASDTRAALRPAFLGTIAGAAVAALMLFLVGDVPAFYAALLPVLMLVGFTLGLVCGPAWMQGLFTLTFIVIFSQLSTPNWHLSEVRLTDVLIGGVVGGVASLLAWPKGGYGALRRDIGDFLARGATACRAVVTEVSGPATDEDPLRPARRAMLLADASSAQYQSERTHQYTASSGWEAALAAGHFIVYGGDFLLVRHRSEGLAPLPPAAVAALSALSERVAAMALRTADAFGTGDLAQGERTPECLPGGSHPLEVAEQLLPEVTETHLFLASVEAWLLGVADDLSQYRRAVTGSTTA